MIGYVMSYYWPNQIAQLITVVMVFPIMWKHANYEAKLIHLWSVLAGSTYPDGFPLA